MLKSACILLSIVVLAGCGSKSGAKLSLKEAASFKKDPQIQPDTLFVSANGQHIAYVASRGAQQVVVRDEVAGPAFDKITNLVLSPDGTRVAYRGVRGKKCALVIDTTETPCDDIGRESPLFSPDSKRVAAVIQRERKWLLVCDGVEGKPYDAFAVRTLAFSPDSKHLSCGFMRNRKFVIAVDGGECKEYDLVGGVVFSPDNRRTAYQACVAEETEKAVLVTSMAIVDGSESKNQEKIGGIYFSPDSKHVAYLAQREKKWFFVIDGVEGKPYKAISDYSPFSPDSQHVAYIADTGAGLVVVLNGAEGSPCDALGCSGTLFTAEGKLAFTVQRGGKVQAVIDGKAGKEYDNIPPGSLKVEGGHYAYAAQRGPDVLVVTDKGEYKCDEVLGGQVFLSPKGTHAAWFAKSGASVRVTVDGLASEPYDGVPAGAKILFDSEDHFSTVVTKRAEIVRVEGTAR